MNKESTIVEYKCPCCNAGLVFGSQVQKLTCEYCDNTFDLDTGVYEETMNYITDVNLLRLRSLSLSYNVPKSFLKKIGVIKAANISVAANNLLLFTNYEGDPEAAAAGAGVGGSSSVGFDYCGVPATSGMTFGLNLTF